MTRFDRYVSRQFRDPTGLGGRVAAAVMSRQNRPLYEATLDLLGVDDTDIVLDIGCGNGAVLALLSIRCGASLTGVDPSPDMVKTTATRRYGLVRQGRLTVAAGDAAHLGFGDAVFTKAFSINTVYFWDDVDAAMTEIRRVLVSGGLFVNTLYSNQTLHRYRHTQTGYRFHEPESLAASARSAGFAVKTVPVLDGQGYCLVCRAAPPVIGQEQTVRTGQLQESAGEATPDGWCKSDMCW